MKITRTKASQRQQAEITDPSNNNMGKLSLNPENETLKISLTGVQDLSDGVSMLRQLADTLERGSSNTDSGGTEASAEASTEAKVTAGGESSAEASTGTSIDAEASAEAGTEAEATEEGETSTGARTGTSVDAEASAEANADAEATAGGESSAEASADSTADAEFSNQLTSLEDLRTWVADKQANDASPTPEKQIREIRVESWLQVPEILRALHDNEGPLRITYPEQEKSVITEEQTEISEFLIENAGQNLAGMLAALEDKIESCHMVSSERVSEDVANEYLKSFSGAISAESSPLLTVAEVVRLNNSFKPLKNGGPSTAQSNKAARDQILATITDTMANTGEYHTCIIEVPTDYVDIAKMFIKQKWDEIPEDERPETQHTKVWVADDFVSSASIKEYDFEDFLRDAKDVPERRQKKKKEESPSSPPGDVVLSSS